MWVDFSLPLGEMPKAERVRASQDFPQPVRRVPKGSTDLKIEESLESIAL